MKFEVKTENDNYSKSISNVLSTFFKLSLIVLFGNVVLKLGIISRHYQIEYNCKLLSVEKSNTNFKRLSRLSKFKNKQKIWEFCREIVN